MGGFSSLRERVLHAAREGRATYLPAGARDNATALVLIDGVVVGQAATCAHHVTPLAGYGAAQAAPLVPLADFHLPAHLKAA